jgi:hypothetical protein
MQTEQELFQPLATEVHPGTGPCPIPVPCGEADLPRCLGVLFRARECFRRTILLAAALLGVAALELIMLLAMPGPTPIVVWEERPTQTLVRMP